jgi:hypothetical protein
VVPDLVGDPQAIELARRLLEIGPVEGERVAAVDVGPRVGVHAGHPEHGLVPAREGLDVASGEPHVVEAIGGEHGPR